MGDIKGVLLMNSSSIDLNDLLILFAKEFDAVVKLVQRTVSSIGHAG